MTTFPKPHPATGILLAGGRSTRLGEPKALLEFGGRALGLHLLERLTLVTQEQIVIANDPAMYAGWGFPIAGDPPGFLGMGPLAGLLAGIEAAAHPVVFAVACDLPFFSPELARYMLGLAGGAEGAQAVIPEHGGLIEPLCAVYTRACREPMVHRLEEGNPRVRLVLDELKTRYVREPEYSRFGATERLFFNINSPGDLAAARELWSSGTT